ncbi:hypothetical protein [Brevundimonas sp. SL130]|uniref:hypothetical protein n=1 Tax=Brevundimonas sp. SL130 TaxID=2995143 RepID=UPI00226CAB02|nr:hypothetical protein [Brevundimonas sp. SL130]WAC60788.1 hypothetical protein OU998_04900 [Brevundimonas sp. SL130]
MADIIAFTAAPQATPKLPEGIAMVVPFVGIATAQARRALDHLRASQERVAAWDAQLSPLRAATTQAKAAARRVVASVGPGAFGDALDRRAFAMALTCGSSSRDRAQAVLDLHAAQRAAGAALARLPRQEARRVYDAAFPGLSPQRVGIAVSALLRDHAVALRFAVEAL